ncbi:MAG: hypothetical protein J5J06_02950 [Phycisphaerae bacterium]|nr:hypothetical protein [Phycisphaerae bacterium]
MLFVEVSAENGRILFPLNEVAFVEEKDGSAVVVSKVGGKRYQCVRSFDELKALTTPAE